MLVCLVAVASGSSGAASSSADVAPPPVYTFPIPGSRVASPSTQIAFRGVPARQLGTITLTGSVSGAHGGTVLADSDGLGGSFVPDPANPFTPGEVVTVTTSLNIVGGTNGSFQFTIASPAGRIPSTPRPSARRVRGDVWRFRSRPDLAPARVAIVRRGRTSAGDIFLAPQIGPIQDGPMIVDSSGNLVWFNPTPANESATDFRVQNYRGRPVLTWWQGTVSEGVGSGEDIIYDSSYRPLTVVNAANGLSADLHEFELTPQGTALIIAYYPVYWDASSVHRSKQEVVLDCVIQELDVSTGLVLFQWDSLDHVPVTDSYEPLPAKGRNTTRNPFDYFHANSIEVDRDGNLVISARNTWAAYKINRQTGAIMWTLGGRSSSFRMGRGASFAFQHDVRVRAPGDRFVTIFDDGAGPPYVHAQSRALELTLDLTHMTAQTVVQHEHRPALLTSFEGNFQQLPDGDDFIGWGQQPYFTEYDRRGKLIFDGRFVGGNYDYRAYRLPWSGVPQTLPAVAGAAHGRTVVVYASWNGATGVSAWRVLAGNSARALRGVASARKQGFETAITTTAYGYVEVQALDAGGRVLGQSAPQAVSG